MNIELQVTMTKKEGDVFASRCGEYGYDVSKMTETLIKNFIQRAALTKLEDERVSQKAYEMKLKHNSKGR